MDPQDEKKTATDYDDPMLFQETLEVTDSRDTTRDKKIPAGALTKSFGRYQILETLGTGAMGAVYLAHDETLDREVAIKVPKFLAGSEDTVVKRFYREARSAAVLSHPNICAIYDVGEIGGTYYIAMQYVAGHSLADYVDSARRQPQDQVTIVARKIALAMHEAHSLDLVHRDLKPANIMIDHRGEPVVMDFGLARRSGRDDARITHDGSIAGSPAYMSPEQLEGKLDDVDPRADIYSLGVVLYEGLTGEIPFKGSGSVLSLITEVVTKTPRSPEEIREDLDPRLCKICLKAMAKNSQDRYATMRDFATALAQFLQQYTSNATSYPTALEAEVNMGAEKLMAGDLPPAVERAQEKCKTVRTLIREKNVEAAIRLLKEIAADKDLEIAQYAEWASRELPRVRSLVASATDTTRSDSEILKLPPLKRKEIWEEVLTSSQLTANLSVSRKEEAGEVVTSSQRFVPRKAMLVWVAVGALVAAISFVVWIVFAGNG